MVGYDSQHDKVLSGKVQMLVFEIEGSVQKPCLGGNCSLHLTSRATNSSNPVTHPHTCNHPHLGKISFSNRICISFHPPPRFSTIVPTVQNIRANMAAEQQVSAANRRLAQQLANRPGINAGGGGGNQAALMYQQQQQMMMMNAQQGRGRGGRGALAGGMQNRGNLKQRLGKSNIKNRLSLPGTTVRGGQQARGGGPFVRGRGRGRGARGANNTVAAIQGGGAGDFTYNKPRGGRGGFSPMRARGRGTAFRGRGTFNRFTGQTVVRGGGGRGQRRGGRASRGMQRGRGGANGGRGRGGRGGGASSGLTAQDLDSQLDDYMSKTKSHLDTELDAYMSEVA